MDRIECNKKPNIHLGGPKTPKEINIGPAIIFRDEEQLAHGTRTRVDSVLRIKMKNELKQSDLHNEINNY